MSEIIIPEEEKGYQCETILDSISPQGTRLVTMRLKYPLIIHAEMCRHRAFSRSVASNRAIPTAKIIAMVEQDTFVPIYWGRNQPGMQAEEELDEEGKARALVAWRGARNAALHYCRCLANTIGLHKQIANRVLNPFQWVTEVITGTDWANFFALRCHPAAQPEIRKIAEMAQQEFNTSRPLEVGYGEWHLPFVHYVDEARLDMETLKKVSAARVARTSYRTHEGKVSTVEEDLTLYNRLVGSQPIHASPTEHLARPNNVEGDHYTGNLRGWVSHRYEIAGHTIQD